MENILNRFVGALITAVITGFVVFLIVVVISMLLPFVSLNATAIGIVAGILAFLFYFVSGKTL